jgi:hypothetical protein
MNIFKGSNYKAYLSNYENEVSDGKVARNQELLLVDIGDIRLLILLTYNWDTIWEFSANPIC